MMHADGLLLNGGGEETRKLMRFLGISVACHVVVFLVLVFVRSDEPVRRIRPGIINVDLVSMPALSGGAPRESSTAPRVREKPPVKKAVTLKKKTVSAKPKKRTSKAAEKKVIGTGKVKKSLKKKTFQPEKVVDSAIAEMKKKVEQSKSRNYQETMERLAEQVEKQSDRGAGRSPGGAAGAGGISGVGYQRSEVLAVYAAEIYSRISKNWSYNEQFADGQEHLVALLGIKVMPDGEIRDVWFDRKSGNQYFDEQARKAVLKTGYLPPLPAALKKSYLEIGLRFTPSGIQ